MPPPKRVLVAEGAAACHSVLRHVRDTSCDLGTLLSGMRFLWSGIEFQTNVVSAILGLGEQKQARNHAARPVNLT